MDALFKENSQKILIYPATTVQQDPYEKNIEVTCLNPLPVRAIVTDLTPTQMKWKSSGIIEEDGKEIIIEKKYRPLLEMSYKLKVGTKYYLGWKINGKMVIREEGNFLRIYIYRKNN